MKGSLGTKENNGSRRISTLHPHPTTDEAHTVPGSRGATCGTVTEVGRGDPTGAEDTTEEPELFGSTVVCGTK